MCSVGRCVGCVDSECVSVGVCIGGRGASWRYLFLSDQPRYKTLLGQQNGEGRGWMGGWVRKVRWVVLDGVGWCLGREWRESGRRDGRCFGREE